MPWDKVYRLLNNDEQNMACLLHNHIWPVLKEQGWTQADIEGRTTYCMPATSADVVGKSFDRPIEVMNYMRCVGLPVPASAIKELRAAEAAGKIVDWVNSLSAPQPRIAPPRPSTPMSGPGAIHVSIHT